MTNKVVEMSHRLGFMIRDEDWDGLKEWLTLNVGNGNGIGGMLSIIASHNLQLKLLKKKDDPKAQELLLLLITLGGKEFVMKQMEITLYFDDGDELGDAMGTLLHAAIESQASIDILMKLIEIGGRELVLEKDEHDRLNPLHIVFTKMRPSMELVLKLIEIGGREALLESDQCGWNTLHYACMNNVSAEFINILIQNGGKRLVLAKDNVGRNSLHYACSYNAPLEVILILINAAGRSSLLVQDNYGMTPLHRVCERRNIPVEIVSKLIEVGGKHLVLKEDECGRGAIHCACKYNAPLQIVSMLINAGGREVVFKEDKDGRNCLHYAVENAVPSIEVVSKLIEVGGRKLVLEEDHEGRSSLHYACKINSSVEVVSKLIHIGGRELVTKKSNNGCTALHMACKHKVPFSIVSNLIETGGDVLLKTANNNGDSALHCVACDFSTSSELVNLLLQGAGEEMLMTKNVDDKTPLLALITRRNSHFHSQRNKRMICEKASLLINKGIELRIGGGFSLGGLFNFTSNSEIQNQVYDKWDDLVFPTLQQVMSQPHGRQQPILQAAIINNAPTRIIQDIANIFMDSVNIIDSLGRYPIDVGVQCRLPWRDGMKDIVESFASAQQFTVIHACAKHGVQWENGMRAVLEDIKIDDFERKDEFTGLHYFMLAAVRGDYNVSHDLDSVFQLIKARPNLVSII